MSIRPSAHRITDWPQSDAILRTVTYRSGDRIGLNINQGFCNVTLADPSTVKRVELFQYRPPPAHADKTEQGEQTLLVTLRSQFCDFTKPLQLLVGPDDAESKIDSSKNVYPYTSDAIPFIVVYNEDDLAPRARFTVDIVSLPTKPRTQHYVVQRTYLALSAEDMGAELRLGGPATGLHVRYYGPAGADDTSITKVDLKIGRLGGSLPLQKCGSIWSVQGLDGSISLGNSRSRLVATGAANVVGARVEQVHIALMKLGTHAQLNRDIETRDLETEV